MDLKYLTSQIKATDGGSFSSIITTPQTDRDGEVVIPTGIRNRAEYLTNPLVYWAHEWVMNPAAEPIGKATRLDVFDDRIESSAEFAPTPKAQNVRALVQGGFVSRTSIGFSIAPGGIREVAGTPTIVAWDLMEYSIVPLPSNDGAVVTGVKSALSWLVEQIGPDVATGLIAAAADAQLDLAATPAGVEVRDGGRRIATFKRAVRPLRVVRLRASD